jgi:deoxyribonuclease V
VPQHVGHPLARFHEVHVHQGRQPAPQPPWIFPEDLLEAVELQQRLRTSVQLVPLSTPPALVAGVDVAYATSESPSLVAAAIVVLAYPTLAVVATSTAAGLTHFPYVPGLLAFRELPFVQRALAGLDVRPDVLVCDGYGVAHPRRFGLASHLGLLTGIPCFGVGKTAFIGTHSTVEPERGSTADLVDDGEVIGAAVRTQPGVKPVFVSAGHLIDLPSAVDLTLRLAPSYRLPETTRLADRLSRTALEMAQQ